MPNTNPKTTISPSHGQFKLVQLLSTNKLVQLLEIAIVFSPVLLVLISFHLLQVKNPVLLITAIWIGNIVMLGLIGLGIRGAGNHGGQSDCHSRFQNTKTPVGLS